MLVMMMRQVVVQETLKIPNWAGGVFGSFDRRRWWMLLGCGMLWRWGGNGSVWDDGGAGEEMDGAAARIEAELGSHGRVI